MNGPVVLNNEDALGVGVSLVNALIKYTDLPTPDDIVVQVGDLPAQGIQRANQPPLSVILSTGQDSTGQGSGRHPIVSALGPAKEAHFVNEHQHDAVWLASRRLQTVQQMRLFFDVSGVGTEARRTCPSPAHLQALHQTPHPTQAVLVQPAKRRSDVSQRPARRYSSFD